jgi:hypothetical protein
MIRSNEHDEFILSTGRRVYAHGGILGLSPDDDSVAEGLDGHIDCDRHDEFNTQPWTDAERAELADYMIALWIAWKERNTAKPA